ncbi:hypothetical protein [Novosphingobium mangrovi (ex Hu et al. 2023)]|uniref:Uncharacterized protein n=1 Tax=Novosphingobium mangrovi (ex Hu et al. 2023) TaxID=2930094 RepID=A0ABT0AII6_9SPHN|nr:hypothetical protein [Novosphingobium mangrovi (ex Hu et al. 2023)]MCJ1962955.1 hypothetical protein [Novosphingobium mangrovi (ex Hu et al. 2023)]
MASFQPGSSYVEGMERSLCIAILPLALVAYFVQGKIAPIKLIASGGLAIMVSLGAAFAGTVMPATRDLSDATAEMLVIGIGAIGVFGVMLAGPALSDIIFRRQRGS